MEIAWIRGFPLSHFSWCPAQPGVASKPLGPLIEDLGGSRLARRLLVIEHYRNDGLLTGIVEAGNATDRYISVLAAGLVSRLDHAAYLGRELARGRARAAQLHLIPSGRGTRMTPR